MKFANYVSCALTVAMVGTMAEAGELDPTPPGPDIVQIVSQVSARQDRGSNFEPTRSGRAAAVDLVQQAVQWGAEWLLDKGIDEDRQKALLPVLLRAANGLRQNPAARGALIELRYERRGDGELYSDLASPRLTLRRVAGSPRIIGYGARADEVLANRFTELARGPVMEAGGVARDYVQDGQGSRYYWLSGESSLEPYKLDELSYGGLQAAARLRLQEPQLVAAAAEMEETLQLERAVQGMIFRKSAASMMAEAQALLSERKRLMSERERLRAELDTELKKAAKANADAQAASLVGDGLRIGGAISEYAGRQPAPLQPSPSATAVSERITTRSGATFERQIIQINGQINTTTQRLRQLIDQSTRVDPPTR
jgi:hypothetical protein